MRKISILMFLCIMSSSYLPAQTNIFPATGAAGIGTLAPDASSLLDITSTTKGILIPRMTKAQRDLIASPVTGLMIYQTNNTPGFYYYSGSAWTPISTKGANTKLSNLVAPTAVNLDLLPNVNNTLNLGSSILGWKDIYLTGSIYSGSTRFIGYDGSSTWVGLYTGTLNTGSYNNALGQTALSFNTTGSANNAFGYGTLYINSTGSSNVAIGQSVLHANTSGSGNTGTGFGALYVNVTGSYNNAFGHFALFNNTTGYSNVAIGNAALYSNTTGHNLVAVGDSALYNQVNNVNGQYFNTAIGSKALYRNTTGNYNNATGYESLFWNSTGSFNTGDGSFSLLLNTTGSFNTANGSSALQFNTTGSSNTANGSQSLASNTTGNSNTANGRYSLSENTTGYSNVAVGASALGLNTTRSNLVAVGDSTLYNNGNGATQSFHAIYNTAVGSKALYSNTIGSYNTGNGHQCLYLNTTGYNNTANGVYALYSNTTGFSNTANGVSALNSNNTGYYNTANGFQALYFSTSGYHNTASGYQSLFANTTGSANAASGVFALHANTTGHSNVAIGVSALFSNTTRSNLVAIGDSALYNNGLGVINSYDATDNTAVGSKALYSNTTGDANTASGLQSLYSNTAGGTNTANGYQSLYSNTSGHSNTGDGLQSLYSNTTGNYNTGLGFGANVFSSGLSNATAVGANAVVDASNKVRVGDVTVTSIGGKVGWTTFPSDGRYKKNIKEDVKGLAFINILKPITYTIDIDGLNTYYDKNRKDDDNYEKMKKERQPAANEASKIVYNGFIAQDVEAAAKKLNYSFSGVDKPKTDDGLYGLRYSDFVVPLVKAVQELSKEVDDLKSQLENQNANTSQATTDGIVKISADQSATALLGQNIPNPFDRSTIIPFRIPKGCKDATIVIGQTGNGKIVRAIPVSCGETQLSLDAGSLSAGTYTYTLYVDGKLIGTKQMILAK